MQLRFPSRGFRQGVLWAAVIGIALLLYHLAPDLLYYVAVMGIMIWGIIYMIKGAFK